MHCELMEICFASLCSGISVCKEIFGHDKMEYVAVNTVQHCGVGDAEFLSIVWSITAPAVTTWLLPEFSCHTLSRCASGLKHLSGLRIRVFDDHLFVLSINDSTCKVCAAICAHSDACRLREPWDGCCVPFV